jgi:flagellar hook protein FlgE
LLSALNTAASALSADSTAVSIVGNNLANLNTTGFKASSVVFQDVFSEALNGGKTQVGLGVQTPLSQRNFSQPGTLQPSSNLLAAAITGPGFFVVKDASGATLYSRDGNLTRDAHGVLQNAAGEAIQGWSSLSGNVNTSGPIGDIVIPTGELEPAVKTSTVSFSNVNLDATAGVGASSTTQVTVYDSLGEAHELNFTFAKTAAATWSWTASLPASDGAITGTGTFTFASDGSLTSPATSPTIQVSSWNDGAAAQGIEFNLFPSGTPAITQYAQAFSTSNPSADGSEATTIKDASIGDGGVINALLSNGHTLKVGQLAMANFVNPDTLIAIGNNDYQVSGATSQAAIGTANTGGRGQIKGSALEASTVDISTEFTNLITFQNSYSANSRVITTANSMEQETVNLIHA